MRHVDEGQLIKRAKSHDARALSDLYRRHADAVFRYVYYRVGDARTLRLIEMMREVFCTVPHH